MDSCYLNILYNNKLRWVYIVCVWFFLANIYVCMERRGGQGDRGGKLSNLKYTIVRYCLKCLITKKIYIYIRVSSISTRFFFCITCTFNRMSLRLSRFKISQCVPFLIKNPQSLSKICKKGKNCEILNLNNQRLVR